MRDVLLVRHNLMSLKHEVPRRAPATVHSFTARERLRTASRLPCRCAAAGFGLEDAQSNYVVCHQQQQHQQKGCLMVMVDPSDLGHGNTAYLEETKLGTISYLMGYQN